MRFAVPALSLLIAFLLPMAGCVDPSQTCFPDDYQYCEDGMVYSVNSCGRVQDDPEICYCGCNDLYTACQEPCECPETCIGKECGPNGCGGTCGECNQPPAPYCDGNTFVAPGESGTCSEGTCDYGETRETCGYLCTSSGCLAEGCDCVVDADCADGVFCTQEDCVDCTCQMHFTPNGTPCGDGDNCTTTDACQDGTCVGVPVECEPGDVCVDGICRPEGCSDACPEDGATQCNGDGFDTCADHDDDGCLDWGGWTECGRCSACSEGACAETCTDECWPLDATQCFGLYEIQTCGDHDADEGYEWSPPTHCGAGLVCILDTCVDDPCLPNPCDLSPDDVCQDADNLVDYPEEGVCEIHAGQVDCSYEPEAVFCEFGCVLGACEPDAQQDWHIDIHVDNFCDMEVVPPEVFVPADRTAVLTYHNNSVDYAVDVWLSYGGGFLDLPTGDIWPDPFEWCTGSSVYDGYADITTACSSHRLMIHCQ